MKNLAVYITLKEIWMWDYGGDLISHELARLSQEGDSAGTGALQTKGKVEFDIKSRRALLSEEEVRNEDEAGPLDPPPDFETKNKAVWGVRSNKEKAHAIVWVLPEEESDDEDKTCTSDAAEKTKFNPDHRPEFFSHVPVDFSDDESDAGSEENFEFADFTINDVEFGDADDLEHDDEYKPRSRSEGGVREEWIMERPGGGDGSRDDLPEKDAVGRSGFNPAGKFSSLAMLQDKALTVHVRADSGDESSSSVEFMGLEEAPPPPPHVPSFAQPPRGGVVPPAGEDSDSDDTLLTILDPPAAVATEGDAWRARMASKPKPADYSSEDSLENEQPPKRQKKVLATMEVRFKGRVTRVRKGS